MKSREMQKHISATYITLRIGIAVLAIALPFILWIGGYVSEGLELQESMSAYYHSGGGAMRDVFVGILFAIGVFLYLYKGFTTLENYALNLAGIFVVAVALVPMEWDCGNSCNRFSLHGTFAVLFFLCIAYVCIFRASDTLSLITNKTKVRRFTRAYKLMGVGMIVSPFIAVLLTSILQLKSDLKPTVFVAEALGVFVFASYWILKSIEIKQTNSERSAIDGKLKTRRIKVRDTFKQISVDRIKPVRKK